MICNEVWLLMFPRLSVDRMFVEFALALYRTSALLESDTKSGRRHGQVMLSPTPWNPFSLLPSLANERHSGEL